MDFIREYNERENRVCSLKWPRPVDCSDVAYKYYVEELKENKLWDHPIFAGKRAFSDLVDFVLRSGEPSKSATLRRVIVDRVWKLCADQHEWWSIMDRFPAMYFTQT